MKILITPATLEISDNHSYSKGAIANIAYNLLYSLSKYEIDLYILSKGLDITRNLPDNLKLFNLTNSRIKNSYYIHTKAFFRSIKLSKWLLKTQNISVISQMFIPYGVGFNPLFKTIRDYPFIIGMCEIPHPRYDDEIPKIIRIMRIGRRIIYPLFLKTLDACDTLIAVNKPAAELYAKLIPRRKIKIIPHGIDIDKFKFTPLQRDNYNILTVGRLIKRKRIDVLIDAMPSILGEYPDTKLHIVGEGKQRFELEKIAKEHGISKNIIFYGNVNEKKLISLYENSFVFCSPQEKGGWNQPILEAMATGRPVVCTDAPHNSMVINNKTGLKISLNTEEWAEKIMDLFADREKSQKMGFIGRKEVEEKYDRDKIGQKYYKVYQEVCKS